MGLDPSVDVFLSKFPWIFGSNHGMNCQRTEWDKQWRCDDDFSWDFSWGCKDLSLRLLLGFEEIEVEFTGIFHRTFNGRCFCEFAPGKKLRSFASKQACNN